MPKCPYFVLSTVHRVIGNCAEVRWTHSWCPISCENFYDIVIKTSQIIAVALDSVHFSVNVFSVSGAGSYWFPVVEKLIISSKVQMGQKM